MTVSPSGTALSERGTPMYDHEPATLGELLANACSQFDLPDALNYKSGAEWRPISSSDFKRRSENVALGLYALGLRRGDRAAIMAGNSPEWTIADAGCQFLGIPDVPIYTTVAESSVGYILRDSGSRVIFFEDLAMFERVAEAVAACDSIEKIIFFDPEGVELENSMSLAELEDAGERVSETEVDVLLASAREIASGDIATIIYTSGTTGEPKGVMLSHLNIISNVIDCGEHYNFAATDVPLSILPLSHIFERTAMYLYFFHGMRVHFAESVDKAPQNLSEVRPTIMIGVPRIFEKVYARAKLKAAQRGGTAEGIFDWSIAVATDYARALEKGTGVSLGLRAKHFVADKLVFKKFREFFGSRLRYCITGGAALPDEIYLIFTGAGIAIMQGYGLTETSPVLTSNKPNMKRLGTVGRPIRNVRLRIAADGEIEAKGPGVMLGYYKKESVTAEVFTPDGWFRTGDIGEIDQDGYLKITDRKKELFKTSGGKYIAPSPIEQMLRGSSFVNQAVLIGNERKFAAALIVPNFEMLDSYAKHKGFEKMTPAEYCLDPRVNDLFRRQIEKKTGGLGKFETVKRFALLENELSVEGGELTPTLKIKRRVIDEKYKDVIDKIYDDVKTN